MIISTLALIIVFLRITVVRTFFAFKLSGSSEELSQANGMYLCDKNNHCTNVNGNFVVKWVYTQVSSTLQKKWRVIRKNSTLVYSGLEDPKYPWIVRNWRHANGTEYDKIQISTVNTSLSKELSFPSNSIHLFELFWLLIAAIDYSIPTDLEFVLSLGGLLKTLFKSIAITSHETVINITVDKYWLWITSCEALNFKGRYASSNECYSFMSSNITREIHHTLSSVSSSTSLYMNPLSCISIWEVNRNLNEDYWCIRATAIIRNAINLFRHSLKASEALAVVYSLLDTKVIVPDVVSCLIAVSQLLLSGEAWVPKTWLDESGNFVDTDADGLSPLTIACTALGEGGPTSNRDFFLQICFMLSKHSSKAAVQQSRLMQDVPPSCSRDRVLLRLSTDAMHSVYASLLSIGCLREAVSHMKALIHRYTSEENKKDLTVGHSYQNSTIDWLRGPNMRLKDNYAGCKKFPESDTVLAVLEAGVVPIDTVRKDSRLLKLLVECLLQLGASVQLQLPDTALAWNYDSKDGLASYCESSQACCLSEPCVLRRKVTSWLKESVKVCRYSGDCVLDVRDILTGGATRGLFLLAYQGQRALGCSSNHNNGSDTVASEWDVPRLYYELILLATSATVSWRFEPVLVTSENAKKPLKVAFLSAFFTRHSVGRLLASVMLGLREYSDLEVHVIAVETGTHRGGKDQDDIARKLRESFIYNSWHTVGTSLENSATYVRQLGLDVLVFGDIFMDTFTAHLAMLRMSPVQIAFWGHPYTSGYPSVDYFISSSLFERNDVHRRRVRYSEQLVLFDTITVQIFPPPQPPPPPVISRQPSRVQKAFEDIHAGKVVPAWTDIFDKPFQLNRASLEQDNVKDFAAESGTSSLNSTTEICRTWRYYGVLQSVMKMHPTFDSVLLKILEKDPCGLVFLLNNPKQPLTMRVFKSRLLATQNAFVDHTIKNLSERLVFVDQMSTDMYTEFVCAMNVTLDPFPFGGGVTMSDSVACGVPFVTLGAAQTVHRLAEGFANAMSLSDLFVADDLDTYVAKATALAHGRSRHHNSTQVKDMLHVGSTKLFEDTSAIREWHRFLIRLR